MPINVDFASIATVGPGRHVPLKGVLSAGPIDVAQSEPANPITLGQWRKGRGVLKIVCQSTQRANYKIVVKNLLPHRMLYGVGATMGGVFSLPVAEWRLAVHDRRRPARVHHR